MALTLSLQICSFVLFLPFDGELHHCKSSCFLSALLLWAPLCLTGLSSHHGKPKKLISKWCIIYSKAEGGVLGFNSVTFVLLCSSVLLGSNPSSLIPTRKRQEVLGAIHQRPSINDATDSCCPHTVLFH